MNPRQFAGIAVETLEDFEKWYEEEGKTLNASHDDLEKAFSASRANILAQIATITGDQLVTGNEEEIPEGHALENYITSLCSNLAQNYYDELKNKNRIDNEKIGDFYSSNQDLVKGFSHKLLSSYTSNPNLKFDEDDGINGEEAEVREQIFVPLATAMYYIKSGKMPKEKVAAALRGIADFFEEKL